MALTVKFWLNDDVEPTETQTLDQLSDADVRQPGVAVLMIKAALLGQVAYVLDVVAKPFLEHSEQLMPMVDVGLGSARKQYTHIAAYLDDEEIAVLEKYKIDALLTDVREIVSTDPQRWFSATMDQKYRLLFENPTVDEG